MARQVDYYFSFQSPWAYIGHNLFQQVAKTYGLKVNYKPVVLVDLFSETGGLPLMKRHPVRQRYRMVEVQRWRDKRGLKFHLQGAARPARNEFASGAGEGAFHRAAGGRRCDRGGRASPRPRAVHAAGICGG